MNPIVTALLGILGPQLLGRLFGGGDSQAKLRDYITKLFSPEALATRANANQAEWYRSPAYGAAQTSAITAGNQAESAVGRAGAGVTSGIDVLRSGAAAGLGSATLAQFNAQAYQQSRELALQQAQGAAQGALGAGPSPNISREMLGSSLNFIGPLLANYLRKKYGGGGGSVDSSMGGWNQPAGGGWITP